MLRYWGRKREVSVRIWEGEGTACRVTLRLVVLGLFVLFPLCFWEPEAQRGKPLVLPILFLPHLLLQHLPGAQSCLEAGSGSQVS